MFIHLIFSFTFLDVWENLADTFEALFTFKTNNFSYFFYGSLRKKISRGVKKIFSTIFSLPVSCQVILFYFKQFYMKLYHKLYNLRMFQLFIIGLTFVINVLSDFCFILGRLVRSDKSDLL